MRLLMIVHCVLIFLGNVAVRTYIEPTCVFCVDIGHISDTVTGSGGFKFFARV